MKRFLLFSGNVYYVSGGWLEFDASYDTLDEALESGRDILRRRLAEWFHVVDTLNIGTEESDIVHEEGEEAYS